MYLGSDRFGNEVVYHVTGWDPANAALTLERAA
jgi:hypothetical protein